MAQLWKRVRLAEVCNFQNGFAFKNSDYVEGGRGGIEIFRMGNILRGGGFNPDGKKAYVSEEQAKKLGRFLLNEGDILMCMTDMKSSMALLGHTAWMPVGGRYLVNQRVGRITVRRPELLDRRFLYYHSNSPVYVDWLRAHANSGVQVNLSTDAILSSPVPLPPLPIQRRIAGILSAYDELIENNQRRIKILESMARALYREWFVHFRFPGHESVPRVPTPLGEIPQGWETRRLGEIAENYDRLRKPLSKMQRAEMQGEYPYYGAAKVFDYVNDFIFDGEYLLMAEDGSVITTDRKPVLQLVNEKFWPNNHTHVLLGKPPFSTHFLYLGLSEVDISPYITGAAQPKITQENMNRIPFFCGPRKLHEDFACRVAPMIRQSQYLERQIRTLRRTRDLLLPRLLSGQIDVEAMPV